MNSFRQLLEHLFDEGSRRLTELSDHWKRHTNRRTILTSIFAGVLMTTLYIAVIEPPINFPINTLINVPEGATLSETAESFQGLAVIRSALALKFVMTLSGHQRDVHAGDYLFKEPEHLFSIARALSIGAYGLEPTRYRVPEGATVKSMAKIFGSQLERFNQARFIALASPMEGYLFPDTYFFLPNANDVQILSTLRENFDSKIESIQQEIDAFGKPTEDVIIMASILEREAHNTEDRRSIAGVLWNRLGRGMLLQVDATFAYTEGKGTFDITLEDLKSKEDLYNTYVHKGLPAGPIGSPSLDSLLAAVTPIKSEYLFYLADHSGVTHYCKTYSCQVANKQKYF